MKKMMKYDIEDDNKRREEKEKIGRHEVCMSFRSYLREIFRIIGFLNYIKDPGLKLTKKRGRMTWRNEVWEEEEGLGEIKFLWVLGLNSWDIPIIFI